MTLLSVLVGSQGLRAQNPQAPPSLKSVPPPEPPNLGLYIKNRQAAIALGKALFWDMQVGSDGIQACASCHFYAGTDHRIKNTLAPGGPNVARPVFDPQHGGAPNYTLKPGDFPFHRLADPNNRLSRVLADSDDIVAPQGMFKYNYLKTMPGSAVELYLPVPDPIFNVRGINVRQCEPRNPPSVFNAVYNYRNFWDGRASNIFNGVNPFGAGTGAMVWTVTSQYTLAPATLNLDFSSLASQAVGPPVGPLEMSSNGQRFADLGKKILQLRPLGKQQVSPTDSVLGALANRAGLGLTTNYSAMIQAAFQDSYWRSDMLIVYDANGNPHVTRPHPNSPLSRDEYALMSANFSLFFGLAVQMYEATLVSDDTPFDRFQDGDATALTAQQQRGLNLFIANCSDCHGGSLFTNAAVDHLGVTGLIERRQLFDGGFAVADVGFMNTGVRKTEEDIAAAGVDPGGRPLSLARHALLGDPLKYSLSPTVQPGERVNVDGAFKVPGLRNIELTGPYFHNGGTLTLEQVVDFYNRGGDFNEHNRANIPFGFDTLGLSTADKTAIVAFMKALTDPRVKYQKAPFDHPAITVPNGEVGNEKAVASYDHYAVDEYLYVPAVGREGGSALTPL